MQFCSKCGDSVVLKIPAGDNRERHVCESCDTIHYQNPRVVAGVIADHNQQILLCRRAIEPRSGFWTLPAGFLENGETTLHGALRECREEACAEVTEPALYGLIDIPHINQVYVFYRAILPEPRFAISPESSEVRLFDERDIPWDKIAFPVIELALHSFLQDRDNGRFDVRYEVISKPWKSPRSGYILR